MWTASRICHFGLIASITIYLTACGGRPTAKSSGTTPPASVAPAIVTQPQSQSVAAGQSATFGVAATGTPPLSYQWSKNGTAIGGATTSTYTTPPTTTSDNGASFVVTVTNSAESIQSSAAVLSVVAPATLNVTINGLPVGVSANVTVSGAGGYTAQLISSQALAVTPGNYTLTAKTANSSTSRYFPETAMQTAVVLSSASTSAAINYSTIVPNTTIVLDAAGMNSLTISPDGSTVTIPESSAVANLLAIGDVLASSPTPAIPNGLLVKIIAVSTNGQTVTATVQQATLEDAIQQGSAEFSEVLGPGNTQSSMVRTERMNSPFRRYLFPESSTGACAGNSNTIKAPFNIPLNGSLSITGEDDLCPNFTFSIQIAAFRVVSFSTTASVGLHASIGLLGTANASLSQMTNLFTLPAAPSVVVIGDVPVVVQPKLTPFVGISGSTAASLYTGATTDTTATVGVSYANGAWSPIDTSVSPTAVSPVTSVDGQISVKGLAGLQASVLIDGVIAPSLSIDGFLQFDAGLNDNPCWTLSAGDEANVAVNVSILGKSLADYVSPTLVLFSNPLAQASSTCFAPVLTSVTPNAVLAQSPDTTIFLSGANFVPDSTASFNGQQLATTFQDPNDISAVIPASALTTGGTFPVTVNSPDNPGGTSSPFLFQVGAVTVSPHSATVKVGNTQSFTATVVGLSSTKVSWSVNGILGGNSTSGTIDATGLYTAPATAPSPGVVTIAATSQVNSAASDFATVTVCSCVAKIYGVALTSNLSTELVSIDPTNGNETSVLPVATPTSQVEPDAIAFGNGLYYFYVGNTAGTSYQLSAVDTNASVPTVTLIGSPSATAAYGLYFDNSSGALYGNIKSGGSYQLVVVNPATGVQTPVMTIASSADTLLEDATAFGNGKYFFSVSHYDAQAASQTTVTLYSVDVRSSSPAVVQIGSPSAIPASSLQFDNESGILYGIAPAGTGIWQLVSIDQITNYEAFISTIALSVSGADTTAFGAENYYFIVQNSTSQYQLYFGSVVGGSSGSGGTVTPVGGPYSSLYGLRFVQP
jgi:Immunoglobulin I-set domain